METKICSCCHEEKNINEFRKSGKYYRGECKKCEAKKHNKYCKTHKEVIKKINQRRYLKNIDKYHKYNIKNREKKKLYNKEYRAKNKQYYKEHARKYNLEHRKQLNEYNRNYQKTHPDFVKKRYARETQKRKSDPVLSLKNRIRNNIRQSFKRQNYVKNSKLEEVCCCSIDELVKHLIKTYELNYNAAWDWKYLKGTHIDHIKPLATAKTEEDVIKLCHYTNLQLLKSEDNLKKGSK